MKVSVEWIGRYSPIAVLKNGQILVYSKGWLYKIDKHNNTHKICKLPYSLTDALKESNRLLYRMFRREIRTSCITESENVFFFKGNKLYIYSEKKEKVRFLYKIPEGKSTPLNILTAKKDTGYIVLWGDYFGNKNREAVHIWGITKKGEIEAVYSFPENTVRHIHNIIEDKYGEGYFIFTGDNDAKAGIYYADSHFIKITPLFIGNQMARAVQGVSTNEGLIYATDSVTEQNYICILSKKNNWEHRKIAPINGSCIYGTYNNGKMFFSTTVESPETNEHNYIMSLLSTRRGTGILSDKVELLCVDSDLKIESIMQFEKDTLPYKLFQYGVVKFTASLSDNLVIYPVGVKKCSGKLGIIKEMS